MTNESFRQRAWKVLENMSLERLVSLFEDTEHDDDVHIPIVRGWLMDAIEKQNPAGFNAWLDSENCADSELRHYVLRGERV